MRWRAPKADLKKTMRRSGHLVLLTLLRPSPHIGRQDNIRPIYAVPGLLTSMPSGTVRYFDQKDNGIGLPDGCGRSATFDGEMTTTSTHIENSCQESDALITLTFDLKFGYMLLLLHIVLYEGVSYIAARPVTIVHVTAAVSLADAIMMS
jgi:hypothetical protein